MITDELTYRIRETLGLEPTAEQGLAIETFAQFMTDRHEEAVMGRRGSAGTGKTTLAAAIVKAMTALEQKLVLLAPTGRAAKVFASLSGQPAYTIHKSIYRQHRFNVEMEGFELTENRRIGVLFICDEASMISTLNEGSPFGTGNLLDDLIESANGQPVLIAYWFKHDRARILDHLLEAGYDPLA